MVSFRALRRRATLLLPALLLLTTGLVQAQTAPQRISFDEAVQLALRQNPQLRLVETDVAQAEVNVSRRRMAFYPDLSFSTTGTESYGRNFSMNEGKIINQSVGYIDLGVASQMNLYDGNRNRHSLRQARVNRSASENTYDRARQTVVFNVMSAYLTLLERREQTRVRQENLETQRQELQRITALTEAGARPIADRYQQDASVATAELDLLNAQRDEQLSEVTLIQLLKLDPFGTYSFEAPPASRLDTTSLPQLGTLLQTALESRPDLRASEMSIESARIGIRAARSSRLPTIGLRAQYGSNYTTADKQFGMFDQLDQRRGGSLGLSFSIPLYDRLDTRNSVQEAQVQLTAAELELERVRQEVAVQVRQSYLDLVSARKRLDATERQETAARISLEAVQQRYNVQAATLIEVQQARVTFVEATSARVQANYDYLFQNKLLTYYLGNLNPAQPLFD